MTHDEELKARALVYAEEGWRTVHGDDRRASDATRGLIKSFAQGYLTLSAKLDTAETQIKFFRESRESDLAMLQELDSLQAALSVKLEELRQWQVTVTASLGLLSCCPFEDVPKEARLLRAKLEEAQANYQELNAGYLNVVSGKCGRGHVDRQPKCPACHDLVHYGAAASPGEIVTACPHCGAHIQHLFKRSTHEAWVCGYCKAEFTKPAYYQKVNGPHP